MKWGKGSRPSTQLGTLLVVWGSGLRDMRIGWVLGGGEDGRMEDKAWLLAGFMGLYL